MPTFNSNLGVWRPTQERSVDINTGEVYEGPDRAARELIEREGGSSLGMDVRKDPENIMRARQLGMSIEDWLKLNEPLQPEAVKNEEDKKTFVQTHTTPRKRNPVRPQGGGVDMVGGFGDTPR